MNRLVLGADGFVGKTLHNRLRCFGTTRRSFSSGWDGQLVRFDCLKPDWAVLDGYDVIYVCAAANGARACEGVQESFWVNVDFPIELARRHPAFIVWVSSMSVEWMDGAYTRQKLACESVLRVMPSVGVVRAGRVLKSNVEDLCKTMVEVGEERREGVTRWGDETSVYEK